LSALQQGSTAAAGTPGQPAPTTAGSSPVSMIMKAMGIQPIPLLSPAELKKEITTESKVFSIYATGYVRSGKRETSVHIHAVVDFRGAPTPDQIAAQIGAQIAALTGQGPPGASSAAAATQPPPNSANSASGALQGIQAALKPGSGGNIVYYRVD
jgi:general secretion pathway protein K